MTHTTPDPTSDSSPDITSNSEPDISTHNTVSAKKKTPKPHSLTEGYEQTRRAHATELAEDYVELIDDLITRHGEARLVDIAEHLGVTHVTANKTVARLHRDGLVQRRPYRAIFLTEDGKNMAKTIRHKHAIVVNFLCAIGVPDKQARIDAEGMEHHISDITLNAMQQIIDDQANPKPQSS